MLSIGLLQAEIIKSPHFLPLSLGTQCPAWQWAGGTAVCNGDYTTDGVYELTGNGDGIYWCWDKAGFAVIDTPLLDKDFILLCRVKEFPPTDTAWSGGPHFQ